MIKKLVDNKEIYELLKKVELKVSLANEEPLKAKQVAEYLKVSISTVRNMTESNEIPCIRKGRHVWYLKSDLLSWLKN